VQEQCGIALGEPCLTIRVQLIVEMLSQIYLWLNVGNYGYHSFFNNKALVWFCSTGVIRKNARQPMKLDRT